MSNLDYALMILLYISKHQQFHILVGKLLLPLKIYFLICEWQKLTCFWHASFWGSRVQELKFMYIYNLWLMIWRGCGFENGHMIYLVNNKFLWNLLWCGQLTTFLHITCSLVGGTHGKMGCSHCLRHSKTFTLKSGGKILWFDCHLKFLPANHVFRRN